MQRRAALLAAALLGAASGLRLEAGAAALGGGLRSEGQPGPDVSLRRGGLPKGGAAAASENEGAAAKLPEPEVFEALWKGDLQKERRGAPFPREVQLVLGVFATEADDPRVREAIRRTWMDQPGVCMLEGGQRPNCSVYAAFVLGETSGEGYSKHEFVLNVSEAKNTGKTFYYFGHAAKSFPWATHIVKMDLDTFPYLGRLTESLRERTYRYREFGEECTVEFDDADLAWSGTFESSSSSGHGEYQDRLRAIQLAKMGLGKADIAKDLGRSERFVAKWWRMEPLAVPRPPGVHQYLAHGMAGGKQVDRASMWRGVEVVRGFARDTAGLYEEVTTRFAEWKQSASETKDFRTASYFLRYDREGKMRLMSMRSTSYECGVVPRLDDLVQKIHRKVGIDDPDKGAGMYWFSDGDASVGSHRHVFWSARVALGSSRIMMVDKTPILMQEGDLVIIGPQRHGVPPMPDVSGGSLRISVPFPPPDKVRAHADKGRSWATPRDDTGNGDQVEADAGDTGARQDWGEDDEGHWGWFEEGRGDWGWGEDANDSSEPLKQLVALGFDEAVALGALGVFGGDVERAVDALLEGEHTELFASLGTCEKEGVASQEDDEPIDDAELARRLQMQELNAEHQDDDLAEQFAEYDRLIDIEEAERSWDGYGDLMHNSMRRATLNLDMIGPQKLYSLGAFARTEKQFFELLSLHAIKVLYDFRPTDYRDEVRCQQPHFEVRVLKSPCRQRGIHYRHVAVGRETAYGVLKHLQSDEVQHILVELCWRAKHSGPTAFLGHEEDWRADGRLAVAEELAKHGHLIEHIAADGSCEKHTLGVDTPDFLVREEAQLRRVHAQRQAGELHRPQKSAVDRSTEAVARTLAAEKIHVDVSAELRDAESQTDLARIQKRMVRMHMAETKKEPGLSRKALSSVPAHIAREAAVVRARVEAKKAEKSSAKQGRGGAAAADGEAPGAASSSSGQLPGRPGRAPDEAPSADAEPSGHPAPDAPGPSPPAASQTGAAAHAAPVPPARRAGRWGHGGSAGGSGGAAAEAEGPAPSRDLAEAAPPGSVSDPVDSEPSSTTDVPALATGGRLPQGRWGSRKTTSSGAQKPST